MSSFNSRGFDGVRISPGGAFVSATAKKNDVLSNLEDRKNRDFQFCTCPGQL